MFDLGRWIEDLFYFPAVFLIPGVYVLFKLHGKRLLFGINILVILVLGVAGRIVYLSHNNLPNSLRYFYPFSWILILLCVCILGLAFKEFKRQKAILFILLFLLFGAMGYKTWIHAKRSWPGYYTDIAPVINMYSPIESTVSQQKTCLLCTKYDTRIELPDGIAIYDMKSYSDLESSYLLKQAKVNYNHIFFLDKTRLFNANDLNKPDFQKDSMITPIKLANYIDGRNVFSLYHIDMPQIRLGDDIVERWNSKQSFDQFEKIQFSTSKEKRLYDNRMSPEQFSDFYVPSGFSIDETYFWSPNCFPVASTYVPTNIGGYWHLKSENIIVLLLNNMFFPAEKQLIVFLDIEGIPNSFDRNSTFQIASISSKTGYKRLAKIIAGYRQQYTFFIPPPDDGTPNYRLGFLSNGEIKIYRLVVYEYQPLTDSYSLQE